MGADPGGVRAVVGAVVMLVVPRAHEELAQAGAPWSSLVVLLASPSASAAYFDYDDTDRLQYVVDRSWIEALNIRYIVGVDGISLPLILLTALIVLSCVIYSWNHLPEPRNAKAFLILILILETGMIGTFVAQDLILFFVFFEIVLLPMYFMIGVWGGENRVYAAIKFFLFTLFGSALMIVSFLALYFLSDPQTFDMRAPARGGDRRHRPRQPAVDLRRHVHRLRHQGADVPVPHLAPRRPHRGADRRAR